MKNLNQYITEYIIKKKLDTPIDSKTPILYTPSTINDLKDIIIELLKDGKTDLNCIDVSNIKSMQYLFSEINYKFEITDIAIWEWDVSNVENMEGMFFGCEYINCNLNNWNVSNVKSMKGMFQDCEMFDGKGIKNWNVRNVENMSSMFLNCENLNSDFSSWNVNNVKYMDNMFNGCVNFEGKGLENWNVSNVTNMKYMFSGCENFDCNLSNWDVSNVEDMSKMFYYCSNFKGKGIDNWNVNKVKDMSDMFNNCDLLDKIPTWKY